MPPLPEPHALAVMLLVAVAFVLFTREKIQLETSSLLILIALVVGFEAFPYQRDGVTLHAEDFFLGFGHEALITICALMIVGKGMETTGALQPLAALLARLWTASPRLSFLTTLLVGAVFSAFLNNTPIVVMLLPVLIGVSIRAKQAASGILLPMGLATLLGGMATTIGTSTNLLVVSIAVDLGLPRFGMFDFALPVAAAGVIGLLYLWLVAPRLLPERKLLLSDSSQRVFDAQLNINEDSFAHGKTVEEVLAAADGMTVISIARGEGLTLTRRAKAKLLAGDRLRVRDTPQRLKEFERALGATLYDAGDALVSEDHPLAADDQQLAEIVITENSRLHHTTLRRARFAEHTGLVVLALHRARRSRAEGKGAIRDIVLQAGDVLLAQGGAESLAALKQRGKFLVLDATTDVPHTRKAPLALGIMFLVVAVAATGLAPIVVAALAGMGLMLLTKCITWDDAAGALSTQVILIVAVSLALGLALMKTGGADYLAQLYVAGASGLPNPVILSGLMLLMGVLTNIVSNNAAAVIGTPIAVSIATQLGLPPAPFVLAVIFGANMSFATPMAYKTNLLIFSAGGYKFSDFLRVGTPLLLIMWIALSFLLVWQYQL
ncbi:MAG: SLC13 family permease [Akkermansiaceae bacterium]|nr:SLC13 family permease [Akkermansiaceae bacterium]